MSHSAEARPETFGLGIVSGQPNRVVVERAGAVFELSLPSIGRSQPRDLIEMFADREAWIDEISAALEAASDLESQDVERLALEAPVIPPTVYCVGTNYYDHVAEMKVRLPDKDNEPLFHFNVPSAAVTGHHQAVHRPAGGRAPRLGDRAGGRHRAARSAHRGRARPSYDAGYTAADDISPGPPDDCQDIFGVRWMGSKGQTTMKPIGPTLIPSRFVPDQMQLGLELSVNARSVNGRTRGR